MIDTISDDVKKVKAKHGEILADPNTDDRKCIHMFVTSTGTVRDVLT